MDELQETTHLEIHGLNKRQTAEVVSLVTSFFNVPPGAYVTLTNYGRDQAEVEAGAPNHMVMHIRFKEEVTDAGGVEGAEGVPRL